MKECAAAALLLLLSCGVTLAQTDERIQPGGSPNFLFKGSPEDQAACRPDATRFCLDDMPDNFRVLACLQKNRTKLRKACKNVLEAHGQ